MDPVFKHYRLNEQGLIKAQELAEMFDDVLNRVMHVCEHNSSREFSLAKTHLEQACFYAKKAMAQQVVNQVIEIAPTSIAAAINEEITKP